MGHPPPSLPSFDDDDAVAAALSLDGEFWTAVLEIELVLALSANEAALSLLAGDASKGCDVCFD